MSVWILIKGVDEDGKEQEFVESILYGETYLQLGEDIWKYTKENKGIKHIYSSSLRLALILNGEEALYLGNSEKGPFRNDMEVLQIINSYQFNGITRTWNTIEWYSADFSGFAGNIIYTPDKKD